MPLTLTNLQWFFAYFWRDIAKDFGGPAADAGQSPLQKRTYSLWVCYLLGIMTAAVSFLWWPIAVVLGVVLARKVQLYLTNTF